MMKIRKDDPEFVSLYQVMKMSDQELNDLLDQYETIRQEALNWILQANGSDLTWDGNRKIRAMGKATTMIECLKKELEVRNRGRSGQ